MDWVVRELVSAELGDARLADRLIHFVRAAAEQPEASIPQACGTAGAKAAYRFFASEGVQPQQILAPHAARAVWRAGEHAVVLAPQDTTTFSFNHHPSKRGLGYVTNDRDSRGLLMHSTLLLTAEGTPLGVLHQEMWSRKDEDYGKTEQDRRRPIEEKESQRWLSSLRAVEQALPNHPQVVLIGDQESDIFELFAAPRAGNVHLLVRVGRTTRLVEHEARYLEKAVESGPKRGEITLALSRSNGEAARTAVLSLKWTSLLIYPPKNHPQRRSFAPLRLQFVLAVEENPPPDAQPVRWLLATTLPVESWDEAVQCLTWYTYRWRIERFHYVLKSGCRIEQLQLETAERLQRAIACYSIVAWRLMWLTYESRQNPQRSCEGVLESHEWQSLCATVEPHQAIPCLPPTLREAVRMIARLGGFLGRKCDGEPGLKTIWLGLRRLDDISSTWKLAHEILSRSPPLQQVGND